MMYFIQCLLHQEISLSNKILRKFRVFLSLKQEMLQMPQRKRAGHDFVWNEARGQGHSDPETICDTP